ncbi:Cyclin-like protein [Pseudocohnilembus persalinus]|uniref:Cyclin-like protein n=1 Tax=Pseudocohnilembus persalinus TaxID=266149 RepID=A0A0V0R384_PSEPJ|nr:Cyclin-like protein [Pseudocohnilembus persalinus]|eukprot:KRX08969.1 Cyclin-like protein [Pseudocohnilembus persalinus]
MKYLEEACQKKEQVALMVYGKFLQQKLIENQELFEISYGNQIQQKILSENYEYNQNLESIKSQLQTQNILKNQLFIVYDTFPSIDEQIINYLHKTAKNKNNQSLFILAVLYLKEKEFINELYFDDNIKRFMSDLKSQDQFIEKNQTKAFKYFYKAACQGHQKSIQILQKYDFQNHFKNSFEQFYQIVQDMIEVGLKKKLDLFNTQIRKSIYGSNLGLDYIYYFYEQFYSTLVKSEVNENNEQKQSKQQIKQLNEQNEVKQQSELKENVKNEVSLQKEENLTNEQKEQKLENEIQKKNEQDEVNDISNVANDNILMQKSQIKLKTLKTQKIYLNQENIKLDKEDFLIFLDDKKRDKIIAQIIRFHQNKKLFPETLYVAIKLADMYLYQYVKYLYSFYENKTLLTFFYTQKFKKLLKIQKQQQEELQNLQIKLQKLKNELNYYQQTSQECSFQNNEGSQIYSQNNDQNIKQDQQQRQSDILNNDLKNIIINDKSNQENQNQNSLNQSQILNKNVEQIQNLKQNQIKFENSQKLGNKQIKFNSLNQSQNTSFKQQHEDQKQQILNEQIKELENEYNDKLIQYNSVYYLFDGKFSEKKYNENLQKLKALKQKIKNQFQNIKNFTVYTASILEELQYPDVDEYVDSQKNNEYFIMQYKQFKSILGSKLSYLSPYNYLQTYFVFSLCDEKTINCSLYILELCLVVYKFQKFKDHILAASILYVSNKICQNPDYCNQQLLLQADIQENDIKQCVEQIINLLLQMNEMIEDEKIELENQLSNFIYQRKGKEEYQQYLDQQIMPLLVVKQKYILQQYNQVSKYLNICLEQYQQQKQTNQKEN